MYEWERLYVFISRSSQVLSQAFFIQSVSNEVCCRFALKRVLRPYVYWSLSFAV